MHDENHKNACMACSCPCEMHKEHNHPIDDKHEHDKHEEVKSCSACGHEQKQDGLSACGCK